MAVNTEKFIPKLIAFKGGRAAFMRVHKAEARIGKDGKPRGKAKYSATVLLDPTNKEQAATIAEIKAESVRALNHRFPADPGQPPKFNVALLEAVANGTRALANFYLCWGYGNDLPKHEKKIYDGFADMFYLKMADENRPNLLNRAGKAVVEGDPECPYAGCYVAGTTTLYSYDNESRGVNANLRTLVYTGKGAAFGGGAPDAQSEYAALGDLGTPSDPFAAPGTADALADPFAI